MAFESAFRERVRDMDSTRNQRLSLLQDEKLLQKNKSLLLSAKLVHISSLEQRCLLLDYNLASESFKISFLKSQIEFLKRKCQNYAQQLRDLKGEAENLEQLEEERENYYGSKFSELEEFKNAAERFAVEIRSQVEELRSRRDELKSNYMGLQKSSTEVENPDVKVAEIKKSELLTLKENVASNLESNKQVRAALEKQLQSLR